MRIGIYVGSFNPVHNVHIKIASLFLESELLDRIVFVPVGDDYEKKGLASGTDRLKMLELATKNELRFSVSDLEVKHKKLPTYTTLKYFSEDYPHDEIFLIMGTDNLKEFYLWDDYEKMLANFKIFVLTRDGLHSSDFPEYASNTNVIFVNFDIPMSSTSVRNDLENRDEESAKTKLDEDVFDYIKKHNLYGGTS